MPLPAILGAGALMVALRTLLTGLWAALIVKAPDIIKKIALGLGIYFFVAKPASSALRSYVINSFSAVSGTALETLYYLNVDDYALAIASAWGIYNGSKLILNRRPNNSQSPL